MKERMAPGFAVFNNHVNRAGRRADREFKAQFGQEAFDEHIAPLRETGIMAIFENPNGPQFAWIALCTAYVNEKISYRLTPDGPVTTKKGARA